MGIIELIFGIAYLANIYKLFTGYSFSIMRAVGIFFPPLGIILGFL